MRNNKKPQTNAKNACATRLLQSLAQPISGSEYESTCKNGPRVECRRDSGSSRTSGSWIERSGTYEAVTHDTEPNWNQPRYPIQYFSFIWVFHVSD